MSDLRDAQIEAARQVLGWEMDPMGEYADQAMRVLGKVVDAVMAEVGPYAQIVEEAPVEHFLCRHDLAAIEVYANGTNDTSGRGCEHGD